MLLRIGNWQGAKVGRGGSPRFALRSSPRYIFRAETVAQPDTARKFIPFGPCSKDRDKDYLSFLETERIFIANIIQNPPSFHFFEVY